MALTKPKPKVRYHQKNSTDVRRLAYGILREAGICVRCLERFAHISETKDQGFKNYSLCLECLKYWRFRDK